jgi:hypothetical protein
VDTSCAEPTTIARQTYSNGTPIIEGFKRPARIWVNACPPKPPQRIMPHATPLSRCCSFVPTDHSRTLALTQVVLGLDLDRGVARGGCSMLGWLRTAGLTDSVGGQECVSDGFPIGRSPQTPRGPPDNRISREAVKRLRLVEKDRYHPFRLESGRACQRLKCIEEARPAAERMVERTAD